MLRKVSIVEKADVQAHFQVCLCVLVDVNIIFLFCLENLETETINDDFEDYAK